MRNKSIGFSFTLTHLKLISSMNEFNLVSKFIKISLLFTECSFQLEIKSLNAKKNESSHFVPKENNLLQYWFPTTFHLLNKENVVDSALYTTLEKIKINNNIIP